MTRGLVDAVADAIRPEVTMLMYMGSSTVPEVERSGPGVIASIARQAVAAVADAEPSAADTALRARMLAAADLLRGSVATCGTAGSRTPIGGDAAVGLAWPEIARDVLRLLEADAGEENDAITWPVDRGSPRTGRPPAPKGSGNSPERTP